MPSTPVSGVRISWLIAARKLDLAPAARSAAARASSASRWAASAASFASRSCVSARLRASTSR